MPLRRREFLLGSAAAGICAPALALTPGQRLVLSGGSRTFGFSNFTGQNLSKWAAADAAQKAGTRNSIIVAAGDSTTGGVGSTGVAAPNNNDISLSYPKQLADLLGGGWQNAVGTHNAIAGGTTIPGFDFRFTRLDAEWFNSPNGTFGGLMLGASNVVATQMNWAPTVPIDTVEVYFARFSSTGIITVNRDGGTLVGTVNTAGGTGVGKQTLTMPLGSHTLEFVGAATAQYIIALNTYNSATKIPLVINGGALAWTAGGLNGSGFNQNQWPYPSGVTAMTPDLVVESIGINDMTGGIVVSTYAGNLAGFSGKMLSTTDLIFMSFPPCNPGGAIPSYAGQQAYVDAMRAQAYATNRPFIDLWRLLGGVYQPSLMFDDKHPNAAGYAVMANYVKQALTPGFRSP